MTVNALWLTGELGPVERMSIASYLHHGHTIDLWSYDTPEVPDGVTLRDAREILPLPILTYDSPDREKGSPLLHVNVWRYKFMHERGGYFTELDQVCLNPLPTIHFVSSESNEHPNLAVLHLPPGSHAMSGALDAATSLLSGPAVKGQFGPKLLRHHINGEFVAPHEWFCPVPWSKASHILESPATVLPPKAIGCHLWGAVIRRNGINVGRAKDGSLWRQWEEKFL